MKHIKSFIILVFIFTSIIANAQTDAKGWQLLDPVKDSVYGISLNSTYQFLKNKKSIPVIVAVIDGGVDTAHEDLKQVLWHNAKEIPGNGIDDDKNGYVDDLYGWNFLGNKNGQDLEDENDEKSRVYYHYKDKFSGKTINRDSLSDDEKWLYVEWQKAAAAMNVTPDDEMEIMLLDLTEKALKKHDAVIRSAMNKDEYTADDLEKFLPQTQEAKQAKMGFLTCLKLIGVDGDETNKSILDDLDEYLGGRKKSMESKTKAPPDYRAQIIKDDYYNFNDRYYGNNDVMGPDAKHGTHVSGIIAAQRNNNLGVDGVADNVKIMMIRAVPNGDEYDKDIALAIRYAVDNGAKVINMSFGKGFSPEKKWVDDAIKYAEQKDVLLVHAAGNESHNVDTADNFPNASLLAYHATAENFISVGASGDPHIGSREIIADFSNYGPETVDVFAPGLKIYSSLPGGNEYGFLQGTSMASPVVAGIAALIRSYYPLLSAKQVKYAIEKSATHLPDSAMLVNKPGTFYKEQVLMSDLSKSGGFVNAYSAVKLAATLKPEVTEAAQKDNNKLQKATLKNNKENN